MAVISAALRQAFMPNNHDYQTTVLLLHRPLLLSALSLLSLSICISVYISLSIVFTSPGSKRPFCAINATSAVDVFPGAFYLTDQETVDYYWMVVFVPSALVFFVSFAYLAAGAVGFYWMVVFVPSALIFVVSFAYLAAGITVAYTAPARHWSLKVVENSYCASKRGGVRCLAILNLVFAIIFGLLALFLGSTLLTLGSNCSAPLFWCYEITSWGLVILYGATAFFLRRKAALILDESNLVNRNFGLEMLEANPVEVTPAIERRVNEGFKSWMGSSYLSSDEEDDPDDYLEVPQITHTNSNRQRV